MREEYGNRRISEEYKHFSLDYIRYPINLALQVVKADLEKATTDREYKVIVARWKLAEAKFKRDKVQLLSDRLVNYGAISKADEYQYYLDAISNYLRAKERELTVKG